MPDIKAARIRLEQRPELLYLIMAYLPESDVTKIVNVEEVILDLQHNKYRSEEASWKVLRSLSREGYNVNHITKILLERLVEL